MQHGDDSDEKTLKLRNETKKKKISLIESPPTTNNIEVATHSEKGCRFLDFVAKLSSSLIKL